MKEPREIQNIKKTKNASPKSTTNIVYVRKLSKLLVFFISNSHCLLL